MSWSKSYASLEDFKTKKAAFDSGEAPEDQLNAARFAAAGIIASGAVGKAGKDFGVYLSGHANEGHEPSPHYATDTITVTVSQK